MFLHADARDSSHTWVYTLLHYGKRISEEIIDMILVRASLYSWVMVPVTTVTTDDVCNVLGLVCNQISQQEKKRK